MGGLGHPVGFEHRRAESFLQPPRGFDGQRRAARADEAQLLAALGPPVAGAGEQKLVNGGHGAVPGGSAVARGAPERQRIEFGRHYHGAAEGIPIQRAAEKTKEANVYSIDFPIKPGETRIDLTYSFPFTPPARFVSKVLHKGGPVRLVAPAGVTLTGAALKQIGQEPSTQATVYELAGADYDVEIQGTGTLRAAEGAEEEGGPGIQQIGARVYDRFYTILGLAFLILLLGFILLYRRSPATAQIPAAPTPQPKRKRR